MTRRLLALHAKNALLSSYQGFWNVWKRTVEPKIDGSSLFGLAFVSRGLPSSRPLLWASNLRQDRWLDMSLWPNIVVPAIVISFCCTTISNIAENAYKQLPLLDVEVHLSEQYPATRHDSGYFAFFRLSTRALWLVGSNVFHWNLKAAKDFVNNLRLCNDLNMDSSASIVVGEKQYSDVTELNRTLVYRVLASNSDWNRCGVVWLVGSEVSVKTAKLPGHN